MKERPILFSAPMVKAILAGTKTQTRRIVKAQVDVVCNGEAAVYHPAEVWRDGQFVTVHGPEDKPHQKYVKSVKCPYGVPGDRLWVRETWTTRPAWDHVKPSEVPKGYAIYTRADEPDVAVEKWRPSIFMPRWASRITLEICEVRAERLNEISETDALAEGISKVAFHPNDDWPLCDGYMVGKDDGKTTLETTPVNAYRKLWESIHGSGSYALNPWVWVIEFRRIDQQ